MNGKKVDHFMSKRELLLLDCLQAGLSAFSAFGHNGNFSGFEPTSLWTVLVFLMNVRWLDSITDLRDMNLSKLQEIVKFWETSVLKSMGCLKSQTQLSH